jgi:hypothetical protein
MKFPRCLVIVTFLFLITSDQQLPLFWPELFSFGESAADLQVREIMEKGVSVQERRRQVEAIAAAFARYTDEDRARYLAALCYIKTLGTPFTPFDLAEIALAETGNFQLSAHAVSAKGARGVWQLMPARARSHGFDPEEMLDDEKCAEAAVRELQTKMVMARGDLLRAKRLYCGVGPAADAYAMKLRLVRHELTTFLSASSQRNATPHPSEAFLQRRILTGRQITSL